MIIYDFSPHIEDPCKGRPQCIAFEANTPNQYYRAYHYCFIYYGAKFPNHLDPTFREAKSYFRKNAKILLACYWNDITGMYDLVVTTRSIIKANWKFHKYDFVGKLTDFASLYQDVCESWIKKEQNK